MKNPEKIIKKHKAAIYFPLAVIFMVLFYCCEKENDFQVESDVTDVDGNVYHALRIGSQVWLAENLKVTHYRNGDIIPVETDDNLWWTMHEGKSCWYNDDSVTYHEAFGVLYNFWAVNDKRGIAPAGWHVASYTEWKALDEYLTDPGYGFEGTGDDIAKSLAAAWGWNPDPTAGNPGNDTATNNSSGFTAIAAGSRTQMGIYGDSGKRSIWWTSSEINAYGAFFYVIHNDWNRLLPYYVNKNYGYYVRCVKDY